MTLFCHILTGLCLFIIFIFISIKKFMLSKDRSPQGKDKETGKKDSFPFFLKKGKIIY